MIITTALLVEAINELSTLDPKHAKNVAYSLSARLIRNGAIEFESDEQIHELVLSIKSAPLEMDARKNLLNMMVRLHEFGRMNVVPHEGVSLNDWNGLVGLVLTSRDRISNEYATLEDPWTVTSPQRMEVASSSEFDRSTLFAELRSLEEQGNLGLGSERRVFWSSILEPLAKLSKKIVISDPWVFGSIIKRETTGRDAGSGSLQALPWLLDSIASLKSGPARSVEIYTSDKSVSASQIAGLFERHVSLGNGSIESVTVYVGSHDVVAHDRHIRFSCGSAITLGAGLDRLDRPDVRDASGLNWAFRSGAGFSSLRDSEERVKTSGRTTIVTIDLQK